MIICNIPKTNRRIIPKILLYIPNFSEEYLPINKPKKVKEAAHVLKIIPDKIILVVIALKPSPVEKLSKLTDIAIKNILNKLNSKNLSSFLIKSINISIPMNNKIKPSKKLTLIFKNVIILLPRIEPNKGIKKCSIPTSMGKNNIFFFEILKVPIDKLIEKVSIDRETPIKNKEINMDTYIT